jgi:hypothetical protein
MTVFDAIVRLTKASWKVLCKHPVLVAFPALSFVAMIAIVIIAAPIVGPNGVSWPTLFAVGVLTHLVRVFFTVGLTNEALKALRGDTPSLASGVGTALGRLTAIASLTLVTSTVGFLLAVLGRSSRGALRIARFVIGSAWSLATYLAIPVMVQERRGGIPSLRRSGDLFARTWGETTLSEVGIRVLTANLAIVMIVVLLIVLKLFGESLVSMLVIATLVVGLSALISALEAIYRAALYVFAAEGVVPEPFGGPDLDDIWRVK